MNKKNILKHCLTAVISASMTLSSMALVIPVYAEELDVDNEAIVEEAETSETEEDGSQSDASGKASTKKEECVFTIYVVDADDEPLVGYAVKVHKDTGTYVGQYTTKDGGKLPLALGYGTYVVSFANGTDVTITLQQPEYDYIFKDGDIPAKVTHLLTVTILDSKGERASGVDIDISDEDGNVVLSATQGDSGSITSYFDPGVYTVKIISRNGYTFPTVTYKVSLSEDISLEIVAANAKTTSSSKSPNGSSSSSSSGNSGSGSSSVKTTNSIEEVKTATVINGEWTYFEDIDKWTLNNFAYKSIWVDAYNPYADASLEQHEHDWFHFDADGYMDTGWFDDRDGYVYYLNPDADNTRGIMLTGWHWIDGCCYYFNEISDGHKGCLYKNATTPDGYTVDADGAWTENGVKCTR